MQKKNAVLAVIRFVTDIIMFLLRLLEGEGGVVAEESAPPQMSTPMGAAEVAETPLWLEIMIRIIETALVASTVAVICYLVYKFVSEMIRRFYLKNEFSEEENG